MKNEIKLYSLVVKAGASDSIIEIIYNGKKTKLTCTVLEAIVDTDSDDTDMFSINDKILDFLLEIQKEK